MKQSDWTNWSVITDKDIDDVIKRLDKLYHDLPMEYCGLALSAIQDVEDILYKRSNT